MLRAIDRKVLRDLWGIRGQAVAICLVIASGVGTFVMSISTLRSLSQSQSAYYEQYRFGHIFAHLKRAPLSLHRRIAEIPGVAQAQTRIVVDVSIDVRGLPEPAIGRLISVPEHRVPMINDLHLRRGRWLEPERGNEVLVSESFAEANSLDVTDQVTAVINGRRQKLTIVGVVLSPEYIIQIQGINALPDNRRFGIFWMGYKQLATAFNMDGAFNNVSLTLMRGASEPAVIQRLDQLTAPYGARGANGRNEHVSHQYISDEIRQLRSMGLIAPVIFFSVAAFLLNVVLTRLVGVQREQIAALKAFGYSRFEIGLHYLKLVLWVAVLGTALGTFLGARLGRSLTEMYTAFYRFPVFGFQLDGFVVCSALGISAAAATLGTLAAVRRAVNMPPAEAMRPEPPAVYRPTLIDRSGLGYFLPQAGRMILREIERKPVKTSMSCLGIAMAVAILVLGSFSIDAINYILYFQFFLSQRQDLIVSFVEPATAHAQHELEHLPGVLRCEPLRAVPTRFRFGHRSRRVSILGMPREADLYRLMDSDEQRVVIPSEGLLLSSKLAELLDARTGDLIQVEVLEGERTIRDVPVTALITEYGGTNAYMNIRAVHRLLREGDTMSAAFLAVDESRLDELYHALKNMPRIAGITVKRAAVRSFQETIAENLGRMRLFNVIFAAVIAFGVVYNNARISLAERSRDLATLRVVGFTRAEISAILLGELAVITLTAIPLGLLLGYVFSAWATLGLDTEVYRVPLVIHRSTYGFSALVVVLAAVVSGLIVRRRLDHLDLIAVLKTRE